MRPPRRKDAIFGVGAVSSVHSGVIAYDGNTRIPALHTLLARSSAFALAGRRPWGVGLPTRQTRTFRCSKHVTRLSTSFSDSSTSHGKAKPLAVARNAAFKRWYEQKS